MKKFLLLSTLILVIGACTQNKTAGEYLGEGEDNGKKYIIPTGNNFNINTCSSS